MKRFQIRYGGILLIAGVLLLAAAVRLYRFPSVPPSLNWDEVSIGYNAYSVLKTGRDEFGIRFPKYFRSLDDYKMPVYIYLTSVSEAIFGYGDFAVRFPSAVAGIILPLFVYGMVKELFREKRKQSAIALFGHTVSEADAVAFVSAICIAVQPWNVQFSRMASEANMGLSLFAAGVWLFLYGINRRQTWPVVAAVLALGVCSYTYLSYRVLAPLIGLILILLHRREFLANRKTVIMTVAAAALIAVSLLTDLASKNVQARFGGTNVLAFQTKAFGDTAWKRNQQEMAYDATLGINIPRRIFHDTGVMEAAGLILRGYFSHFSPEFLFFDTTQKLDHTPFVGLLYVWMIVFIPIGAYAFVRTLKPRAAGVLIALTLITPIPAALTWDVPHPIRTLPLTVPFAVAAGFGIVFLYMVLFAFKRHSYIYICAVSVLMIFSLWHYGHQYLIHLPHERSENWQYGRKELAAYLTRHQGEYDRIIVSSELEWPYIFLLYYSRYDPGLYLSQGGTVSGGWGSQDNRYGKYEFRSLSEITELPGKKTLVVAGKDDSGSMVNRLKVIDYLDGTPAIIIGEL